MRYFFRFIIIAAFCSNAAAFQLAQVDGARTDIAQHTGDGKWTLVMLWSLSCVPCEQQKPMIQAFHDAHADHDARVVAVALDGPAQKEAIAQRIAEHHASYTNLIAFPDVIAEQLLELTGRQVLVTPAYLLYKPDGSYAGTHTGPIQREQLEAVVVAN